MIIKQELVKKIKDYFNLNIYETKIWLALLTKGIASAGETAELSGVPRSRAYDVLESLEKRGFAIAKVGKPTKYIVVKPTIVLENLKRNTFQKAEEKVKVLDNLKETKEYEELESLHQNSFNPIKREEISGLIRGKAAALSHARSMIENAEKEVLICLPASDLFEKKRVFNAMFENLAKRNLNVKLSVNGKDEEVKKIAENYKVKIRKTNLKSKFFIIDRKQILFSLNSSQNDEEEIAVWLNSEFFSNALVSLFEQAHK